MAKRIKIKRYRHIYRRRRFSGVKFTAVLLAVAAAAFVGASLYRPLCDFFSGRLLAELEREKNASSSEALDPPAPEESSTPEPEAEEPEAPPASLETLRAVEIPREVLLSGDFAAFLEAFPPEETKSVVLELKAADGSVLFQTEAELAVNQNAVEPGAVNLAETVDILHGMGYQVAGRIGAFRDPKAPYAFDRSSAVKYMDTGLSWVDNDPNAGGNPWLNPYAPQAQDYIRQLVLEAAGAGVDTVLLEYVQFPEGIGTRLATYGEWESRMERSEVLRTFVDSLREEAEQEGTALACAVPASAMFGEEDERYGGARPAEIFGGTLIVEMMPSLFGEQLIAGDTTIYYPGDKPYETIQAVLRQLDDADVSTLIAMIESGSSQFIEKELRALAEHGVENYIIR